MSSVIVIIKKIFEYSCTYFFVWICHPLYLARKEKQKELDIEFNNLGSRSLFASPGSYSFTHQRVTALCGPN